MPTSADGYITLFLFFALGLLCLVAGNKVTEWLINESIRKEAFQVAKDEYYRFFEARFTLKGEEAVSAYNLQAIRELEQAKKENERLRAVLSEKGWDCDIDETPAE